MPSSPSWCTRFQHIVWETDFPTFSAQMQNHCTIASSTKAPAWPTNALWFQCVRFRNLWMLHRFIGSPQGSNLQMAWQKSKTSWGQASIDGFNFLWQFWLSTHPTICLRTSISSLLLERSNLQRSLMILRAVAQMAKGQQNNSSDNFVLSVSVRWSTLSFCICDLDDPQLGSNRT